MNLGFVVAFNNTVAFKGAVTCHYGVVVSGFDAEDHTLFNSYQFTVDI